MSEIKELKKNKSGYEEEYKKLAIDGLTFEIDSFFILSNFRQK